MLRTKRVNGTEQLPECNETTDEGFYYQREGAAPVCAQCASRGLTQADRREYSQVLARNANGSECFDCGKVLG